MDYAHLFIEGRLTQEQITFLEKLDRLPEGVRIQIRTPYRNYEFLEFEGEQAEFKKDTPEQRIRGLQPNHVIIDEGQGLDYDGLKRVRIGTGDNTFECFVTDPQLQDPEGWRRGDYEGNPAYAYLFDQSHRDSGVERPQTRGNS